MKRENQLRILNRIATICVPTDHDGTPNVEPYSLSSQGKLQYRARNKAMYRDLSYSIEDAIHSELARAEKFGIGRSK